jgi:hypothetical protein
MKHALNDNLLFNPFDNKYTTVIKCKQGRRMESDSNDIIDLQS